MTGAQRRALERFRDWPYPVDVENHRSRFFGRGLPFGVRQATLDALVRDGYLKMTTLKNGRRYRLSDAGRVLLERDA